MQDPFVGQITLFAFQFAPAGWLPCQGQLLPISQNTALYSVLGNSFGGDGKTTFALPDFRSYAPKGLQYCIALQGVFPQGAVVPASVGELAMLPYDSAPRGWANCRGQLLAPFEYESLFHVLGKRFGGDGETDFGLPNLAKTPPPGTGEGDSLYFISTDGFVGAPSALLGTVQLMPFDSAPAGWAACDGRLLQIAQHPALFSVLGTTFGGDGRTTFGLPDLGQLPIPAGLRYYISMNAPFPRSAQGGPGGAEEGAGGATPDETGGTPAGGGGD